MKLGIDFGTSRTVISAADRGNFPLVSFEAPDGSAPDWFPSLVAVRGEERRYGWQAWYLQADPSWTGVRSIKRLLEDAGPETLIDFGETKLRITDLLDGFAAALYEAIRDSSNLRLRPDEPLEAMLGVPAHANSNQRFLTLEAFRSTGFKILGVLNEASAASIEFGHRQREGKGSHELVLVYDLGGGTFDASLVALDENVHHVVDSVGIPTIGGDDFDHILADMALEATAIGVEASGEERNELPAAAWFRLLEECRTKKEALNPNSRRLTIDLEQVNPEWGTVQIAVADFYEAARPLVEETIGAAEDLLTGENEEFDALYITGGGSELPLVARVLRERFGRRVRRSAYTRSATAIGLAIQAAQPDTYKLSERLARYFGVWREADHGARIVFDPLFQKGTPLPPPGEPVLSIRRDYSPVHNVGHFRFLECTHRTDDGVPTGEVTMWDDIHFPFDPGLESQKDLHQTAVQLSRDTAGQHLQEVYECDASGAITVKIANCSSGYSQIFRLGRWSEQVNEKPAKAAGRRKQSATATTKK